MVDSEHRQLLEQPVETRDGVAGIERPKSLVEAVEADPTPLLDLAYRHVVSARLFDRAQIVQLCRLAAEMEMKPALLHLPLSGKIMISAFYEPSTRTRLSFESAWHRLGGDVISITDRSTTGIAKGESFSDVAEMFSNYGDVVVLRESSESAVYEMMRGLRVPIINAGNGVDEHPTQALSDVYAMLKWNPRLADPEFRGNIRVGIIGVPSRMRTVRSLLLMLGRFSPSLDEVTIVCPSDEPFDEGQREELEELGLGIRVVKDLKDVLPTLDVVYINSIAWVGNSFERLTGDLALSASSPLKEDAIVMHPLARGDELATDLDDTRHNWYFAQARGAVFVRMALLSSMTQRVSDIADLPRPELTDSS